MAKVFEVNVLSGVRLSRAYLPLMKQKNWGRIVFISSESAIHIPVEMVHYGFTKTAQLAVSRGLAESTAGTGVTVNAVLPGPTASEGVSDFVSKLAAQMDQSPGEFEKFFFEKVRPASLLKRFATTGRSRESCCLCLQSTGFSHERGRIARRWGSCSDDHLRWVDFWPGTLAP